MSFHSLTTSGTSSLSAKQELKVAVRAATHIKVKFFIYACLLGLGQPKYIKAQPGNLYKFLINTILEGVPNYVNIVE